jgi:hypothetical protein
MVSILIGGLIGLREWVMEWGANLVLVDLVYTHDKPLEMIKWQPRSNNCSPVSSYTIKTESYANTKKKLPALPEWFASDITNIMNAIEIWQSRCLTAPPLSSTHSNLRHHHFTTGASNSTPRN